MMETIAMISGLFGLALFAGWWAGRMRAPQVGAVPVGARLRLRTGGGLYRSRVVSVRASGVEIEAPLKGDAHVPLRPGESVAVEIAAEEGVLAFRTHILDRNPRTKTFLLAVPSEIRAEERRASRRVTLDPPRRAEVNGEIAALMNISEGGARLVTLAPIAVGDWVRVGQLGKAQERYAVVLEVQPASMAGQIGAEARVIFTAE